MPTHLNLLPQSFRRRLLMRTRLGQWAVVWLMATAAVLALAVSEFHALRIERRRLAAAERRAEPVRKLLAENTRLQRQVAALANRQSLITRLERETDPLQLVGVISQSTDHADGRIQVRRLSLETVPPPPAVSQSKEPPSRTAAAPTPAPPPHRVRLSGRALDDFAVARFVGALERAEFFETVELKSSATAETNLREYVVECSY
ncbi:MAG: PilN domain-containing protein [Planctomycetaceae bacterium]